MTVFFFLTDSLQFVVGKAAHPWPCLDPRVCLCLTAVTMCKDHDLPQTNTHVSALPFEVLQSCGCSTCPQGLAFSPKEPHSISVAPVYAACPSLAIIRSDEHGLNPATDPDSPVRYPSTHRMSWMPTVLQKGKAWIHMVQNVSPRQSEWTRQRRG